MNNLVGKSFGRYHITDRLGEGGMASVFKAYDITLERYVAIKVIRRDRDDDSFLKRFEREAKALAQMDHPYILKVLDYGEQDGMPFLVMPLIAGGTLKQSLTKAIPYLEASALLGPIARALEYAHQQGIVHRDVKPANILISQLGAPILSDFGVAKILDQRDSTQLTGTGVGIGTPDYMAPEQWMGQVDPRTDIYALGIVFFQMVTGKLPYTADTPAAVLLKHINDPLPEPKSIIPDLPDVVSRVIYKALAKEPNDRFQDMGAFALALEKLSRSEVVEIQSYETRPMSVGAKSIPADKTPVSQPNKSKVWLWVGGAVIVGGIFIIICLLLGGLVWFTREDSSASSTQASEIQQQDDEEADLQEVILSETPEELSIQSTEIPVQEATLTPEEAFVIESIEGFPEDIPILADNNGDLTTTTAQGMNMYTFSTNMSLPDVQAYYENEMVAQGWELVSTTTQGDTVSFAFAKEEYNRVVMVNISEQAGSVLISLILVEE